MQNNFVPMIRCIAPHHRYQINSHFIFFNLLYLTILLANYYSKEKIDSILLTTKDFVTEFNLKEDSTKSKSFLDTYKPQTQFKDSINGLHIDNHGNKSEIKYFKGKAAADSLKLLTNLKPIFISFI